MQSDQVQTDGFAQLLEELPLGVVEVAADGTVTSSNQNARLLMSSPDGELRGVVMRIALQAREAQTSVEHAVALGRLGELRMWAAPSRWSDGVMVVLERNVAARSRLESRLMSLLVKAATSGDGWVQCATRALETLSACLPGTHLVLYEWNSRVLSPTAHAGIPHNQRSALRPLPDDTSELIATCFSGKRVLAFSPISASPLEMPFVYPLTPVLTALAVPVMGGGAVRGVFYACGPESVLQEPETRLLLSLGEMLGMLLEQKRRDAALQAERDRFSTMVDHLPDAVLETLPSGFITLAGGRVAELLGAQAGLVIGSGWRDWVVEEDWPRVPDSMKEPVDVRVRRNDGTIRVCSLASHEAPDEVTRLVFRDMTASRRLQAEAAAMKDAAAKNERLATLGRLAAGVGHELNNPLSYLATNLGAMQEEIDDVKDKIPPSSLVEIRSMLDDCQEGVRRLVSIVQALKGSSRQGNVDANTEFDPSHATRSSVTLFRSVHRHNVTVDFEDVVLPKVKGSSGAVAQVVLNLLQNGLESMGGKGALSVKAYVDAVAQMAVVEVTDNGPGIPESVQERLFEAFYTTKGEGVGTGLGLYLCQQMVQGMRGTLTFQTGPKGTTFFLKLPLIPVVIEADPDVQAA